MTKWLWSIAIAGLLATGCGVSKDKPYYDQRSTQNSHVEEQDLTT